MIGSILQFEDLQALTGYQRLADVERQLTQQGIPFKRGRRGIWTTMAAVNAALGVHAPAENDPYSPDQAA